MRKLFICFISIFICAILSSCLLAPVGLIGRITKEATAVDSTFSSTAVSDAEVTIATDTRTTLATTPEHKEFESLLKQLKDAPYKIDNKSITLVGWIFTVDNDLYFTSTDIPGKEYEEVKGLIDDISGKQTFWKRYYPPNMYKDGRAFLLDTTSTKKDLSLYNKANVRISGIVNVSVKDIDTVQATIKCKTVDIVE